MTSQEIVNGKYKLLELLGSGGWGDVYKGENIALGKPIAVKMLHAHLMKFPDKMERFTREAKAASMLDHPGIGKVFDVGTAENGRPFYVMEFVEGRTLASIIDEYKRFAVKEAVEIATQVAQALSVAHAKDIVHRDVTPGNIIIRPDGQPLLLDFGLAKISDGLQNDRNLTESGATIGSPAYMSPEQCMGRPADARSDIYSLACVVYEMLAGHPPFQSTSLIAMMHSHVNEKVEPFEQQLAIPQNVSDTVLKALSKKADDRQKTMAEFCNGLIEPSAVSSRFFAAKKQKAMLISVCLGVLAVAAAGGVYGYYIWQDQEKTKARQANVLRERQLARQHASDLWGGLQRDWSAGQFNSALRKAARLTELCKSNTVPTEDAADYLSKTRRVFEDTEFFDMAVPTARAAIEKLKQIYKPNSAELIDEQLALSRCLAYQGLGISFSRSHWGYPVPLYEDEKVLKQIGEELKTADGLDKQLHNYNMLRADLAFITGHYKKVVELDTPEYKYLNGVSQTRNGPTALYSTFAQALMYLGRTDDAMAVFSKAVERVTYSDWGSPQGIGAVYANIANVVRSCGNYPLARQYFEKSTEQFDRVPPGTPGKADEVRLLDSFNLLDGDPTHAYLTLKTVWREDFKRAISNGHWKSPYQKLEVAVSGPGVFVAPLNFDRSQLRSIPDLSSLEELNFTGTSVTDADIASLGHLPKLRRLKLACTDITDDIAGRLSQFPNLEVLELQLTPTGAKTARAVARLRHLEALEVQYTQFKENELRALAESSSLKRLNLAETALTDRGLMNLSGSRSLEELDLHFTSFTDSGLAALGNIPHLKHVELFRNRVSGTGLEKLTQLTSLYMTQPIADTNLSSLKNLKKLKVLLAANMPVSDDMVACLPTLTDLEDLTLASTDITDKTLRLLPSLPHLKALNINHINMTDEGVKAIAQCKNLEMLSMAQNNIHDISPLAALSNLKSLYVSDNPLTRTDLNTLTFQRQSKGTK